MGSEEIIDDELSPKELAELSRLVDPDKPTQGKYDGWNKDSQREILALLLNDRSFMLESVALLKPFYFTDEAHILVSQIAFDYFDKYKSLPNRTILLQELRVALESKTDEIRGRTYTEFATVMEFYRPGSDTRDHYLDQVVNFAKTMALKNAIRKVFDLIKKNPNSQETWTEIGMILKEAQTVDRDFNIGLDYFNTAEERYNRRRELMDKGDIFITGFPTIDNALKNKGLLRGEMGCVMGGTGTGKSVFLVNAALANLYLGKKVLYISLEINQDAVAERFDAQLADPEGIHGVTTGTLLGHKDILFNALSEFVKEYNDEEKCRMIVKQFAGGQMGMAELRAYFSQIVLNGFRPDLVIIDYIGEMKDYPGVKTHESRGMIVRDLRGFGVEENCCILSALQPNRTGKEANRMGLLMDEENLGDSMAQSRPLDGFWTLAQTQEEKECCLGRINISKHREGKSKIWFHIRFNYDTLSMKEISAATYDGILKKHQSEREVDTLEHAAKQIEAKSLIERGKANTKKKVEKTGNEPPLAHWKNDGPADAEINTPDSPESTT